MMGKGDLELGAKNMEGALGTKQPTFTLECSVYALMVWVSGFTFEG